MRWEHSPAHRRAQRSRTVIVSASPSSPRRPLPAAWHSEITSWSTDRFFLRGASRRALAALALFAGASFAAAAYAQTTYSTQQILDFFVKDKAAAEAAKAAGKTRSLCIGTAEQCPLDNGANIARFDLLVNFDYDSDKLTKAATDNLDLFIAALKDPKLAGTKFEIDGHTDASGGEEYNQGLSERRAQSVVAYLAAQGVDASTLTAKGFGKTKPRVADPLSPENRRVETHLLD